MSNRHSNLGSLRVFQQAITAGGTSEKLTVKIRATTLAFVDGGGQAKDTITDSGNGFLIAGFKPGDQITVSGAGQTGNNNTFVIDTVVAGTITLTSAGALTAEAAGATVKIVAPISIPEGIGATIKSKYGNSNNIFIGHSSASAKATGYTLRPNEAIVLQITSTDVVWIDGTTGEGVEVIFETNPQQGE